MTVDEQKKAAAEYALKVVEKDTKIGLGTGSTANYFIEAAAAKVKRENLNTIFVPTSAATYGLAAKLGMNIQNIENVPHLDFTVDGADEIDPQFRMIKGGGGALHREKIVASSSRFVICICDDSKRVNKLGKFPVPVEVSKFGVNPTAWKIESALSKLGYTDVKMRLRANADGKPFVTESGNAIIDMALGRINDPERLEGVLNNMPGVIEVGIFIGICGVLMLGTNQGVEEITRK